MKPQEGVRIIIKPVRKRQDNEQPMDKVAKRPRDIYTDMGMNCDEF
jgi:hypothetical protein